MRDIYLHVISIGLRIYHIRIERAPTCICLLTYPGPTYQFWPGFNTNPRLLISNTPVVYSRSFLDRAAEQERPL